MSKYTNLQIVQMVLSAIDGDNVNGMADTEEAVQVGLIMRRVYDDLASRFEWENNERVRKPISLSDLEQPVLFKIPENVTTVKTINYRGTTPTQVSLTDYTPGCADTARYTTVEVIPV